MGLQDICPEYFPELYRDPVCAALLQAIPIGQENGVRIGALAAATGVTTRTTREKLGKIRAAGVVVCATSRHGYFYPANAGEVRFYTIQEERRFWTHYYSTVRYLWRFLRELEALDGGSSLLEDHEAAHE